LAYAHDGVEDKDGEDNGRVHECGPAFLIFEKS
jgi:hypothetical protein